MFVHHRLRRRGTRPKAPKNSCKTLVHKLRCITNTFLGFVHHEDRLLPPARVSTDAQETHLQLDALQRAKCSRIYEEKASGATADRPELLRLLDHARQGDVVIVWKLDRLARSLRQLIDTAVLFHERGVELQSLTENINTTTPSGKLTFHLFAALAEFERDLLRQRVTAGLQAARQRGRVGGRPKALTADDLKKARALLRSGEYTKVEVAKRAEGQPPYALACPGAGGTVVSTRSRSDPSNNRLSRP